ncbi:MAG: tetratricopeptide repeat protein [Candidatus Saccharibacteria bacterium]
MERNSTERVDDGQAPSETTASQSQSKKSKSKSIVSAIKKFWYIIVIIVAISVGFFVWRANVVNSDNAWARATAFYQKADYDNAAKEIANLPVPTDNARLKIYAQTMLAKRDLEKALPAYEKLYAATKEPNYKIILGNIYNEQKNYDKAASTYKEVIADNPGYTQAYVNLAILYKLQNKISEAMAIADSAVKSNPNNVTLLELKVSILMEDKTTDDFKTAVKDLAAINPQDPLLDSLK